MTKIAKNRQELNSKNIAVPSAVIFAFDLNKIQNLFL